MTVEARKEIETVAKRSWWDRFWGGREANRVSHMIDGDCRELLVQRGIVIDPETKGPAALLSYGDWDRPDSVPLQSIEESKKWLSSAEEKVVLEEKRRQAVREKYKIR